ncbi:hypothetical protein Ancab_032032, partial [Ancistrocladus abbreviatus]
KEGEGDGEGEDEEEGIDLRRRERGGDGHGKRERGWLVMGERVELRGKGVGNREGWSGIRDGWSRSGLMAGMGEHYEGEELVRIGAGGNAGKEEWEEGRKA